MLFILKLGLSFCYMDVGRCMLHVYGWFTCYSAYPDLGWLGGRPLRALVVRLRTPGRESVPLGPIPCSVGYSSLPSARLGEQKYSSFCSGGGGSPREGTSCQRSCTVITADPTWPGGQEPPLWVSLYCSSLTWEGGTCLQQSSLTVFCFRSALAPGGGCHWKCSSVSHCRRVDRSKKESAPFPERHATHRIPTNNRSSSPVPFGIVFLV